MPPRTRAAGLVERVAALHLFFGLSYALGLSIAAGLGHA
jgi:hypothetical protein